MAIKLGNRPKSFKRIVKFGLIEGGEGSIECTFKYRTRTEFGIFVDKLVAKAQAKQSEEDQAAAAAAATESGDDKAVQDAPTMERIMSKTSHANADYLMDVLEGWCLDVPLTLDNARIFADEYPAACMAIMEDYRAASTEGRLGN